MKLEEAKQHIRTLKWVAQKIRSNTAEAHATTAAKLLEPELFAENSPIVLALDAYETKGRQGTLTPLDLYNALVLAKRGTTSSSSSPKASSSSWTSRPYPSPTCECSRR